MPHVLPLPTNSVSEETEWVILKFLDAVDFYSAFTVEFFSQELKTHLDRDTAGVVLKFCRAQKSSFKTFMEVPENTIAGTTFDGVDLMLPMWITQGEMLFFEGNPSNTTLYTNAFVTQNPNLTRFTILRNGMRVNLEDWRWCKPGVFWGHKSSEAEKAIFSLMTQYTPDEVLEDPEFLQLSQGYMRVATLEAQMMRGIGRTGVAMCSTPGNLTPAKLGEMITKSNLQMNVTVGDFLLLAQEGTKYSGMPVCALMLLIHNPQIRQMDDKTLTEVLATGDDALKYLIDDALYDKIVELTKNPKRAPNFHTFLARKALQNTQYCSDFASKFPEPERPFVHNVEPTPAFKASGRTIIKVRRIFH
jgi:hypothetical protein